LSEKPNFPDTEPRHPIQVVVRRTGLSADLIRVWERRYQAVSPQRSTSSRRLYSDADIERLILLHRATLSGRRISDVASLPETELSKLITADEKAVERMPTPPSPTSADETAMGYVEACLDAARLADPVAFEQALSRAAVAYSIPELFERVLTPLLRKIGQQWQEGMLRSSHEHMATAAVRSFLGTLAAASNMAGTGPTLLVTTPRGQDHEMGSLMAAVIAATDGWNVAYLAPNLPANEIAVIALQRDARAVALGITYPGDDPHLPDELRLLRSHLPKGVAIIVGGSAADGYADVLQEIGAVTAASLEDFRAILRRVRSK